MKPDSQYATVVQAFQDSLYAMLVLFPLLIIHWDWGHLAQGGIRAIIGSCIQFFVCWLGLLVLIFLPHFCNIARQRYRLARREKQRRRDYVIRQIRHYLLSVSLRGPIDQAAIRRDIAEIHKNSEYRLKKYCGRPYP